MWEQLVFRFHRRSFVPVGKSLSREFREIRESLSAFALDVFDSERCRVSRGVMARFFFSYILNVIDIIKKRMYIFAKANLQCCKQRV